MKLLASLATIFILTQAVPALAEINCQVFVDRTSWVPLSVDQTGDDGSTQLLLKIKNFEFKALYNEKNTTPVIMMMITQKFSKDNGFVTSRTDRLSTQYTSYSLTTGDISGDDLKSAYVFTCNHSL